MRTARIEKTARTAAPLQQQESIPVGCVPPASRKQLVQLLLYNNKKAFQ